MWRALPAIERSSTSAGERFPGFVGEAIAYVQGFGLKAAAVFHMKASQLPDSIGETVVKALLIVIVAQFGSPDVTEIQAPTTQIHAPTILYFPSMELCEQQKGIIIRAFDEMTQGALSGLPQNLRLKIAARCSPASRW
ncbi:MAG: hypothetical protein WBA88_26065 [Pseudaminobacter sp.]